MGGAVRPWLANMGQRLSQLVIDDYYLSYDWIMFGFVPQNQPDLSLDSVHYYILKPQGLTAG